MVCSHSQGCLDYFRIENLSIIDEASKKLGDKAYTISDPTENYDQDSDDEDSVSKPEGFVRMSTIQFNDKISICSTSEDEESRAASPVQEDSNSKTIVLTDILAI